MTTFLRGAHPGCPGSRRAALQTFEPPPSNVSLRPPPREGGSCERQTRRFLTYPYAHDPEREVQVSAKPAVLEFGMGVDVHGLDGTKAASRAVSDAIRHSSRPLFRD